MQSAPHRAPQRGAARVIRALPALALTLAVSLALAAVASPAPAYGAASTTSSPDPARLAVPEVLGDGALRFDPPATGTRSRTARRRAQQLAATQVRPEALAVRARVVFALFSATSPAHRTPTGSIEPLFQRRPVWLVQYRGVRSARSTGVVARRRDQQAGTTTTLAYAITDIAVVIDDRSGETLLTSEYAASA